MVTNHPAKPPILNEDYGHYYHCTDRLTLSELAEIALYTIQKIHSYPRCFGKTVDNYFHLLFPDEVKNYLMRRMVNDKSFMESGLKHNLNEIKRALVIPAQVKQVQDIKILCQLLVNQHESVLRIISDRLDELEADLYDSFAGEEVTSNGK